MRKIILIMILPFALAQCMPGFPELETNPLKVAFQKNGIKGYYEISSLGDSVCKVHIDSKGNIIKRVSYLKMWPSTTTFSFDSLDRLASNYHYSDIHYTFEVKYAYHPDDKLIEQHWIETSGKEPKHDWTHLYKLEGSSNRPVQMIRISAKDGDTLNITTYNWNGKKIISEVTMSDIYQKQEINYIYDRKGQLERIEFWSDGMKLRADYISKTTGLVDSSINRRNEISYIRYY